MLSIQTNKLINFILRFEIALTDNYNEFAYLPEMEIIFRNVASIKKQLKKLDKNYK